MLVRNKTGDKLALGAALYMLAIACRARCSASRTPWRRWAPMATATTATTATMPAVAECERRCGDDEAAPPLEAAPAREMVRAGAGASKLLARAAAAKEVQSKDLAVGDGGGRSSAATLQKDDDMTFEDVADGDGDDAGVGIDD